MMHTFKDNIHQPCSLAHRQRRTSHVWGWTALAHQVPTGRPGSGPWNGCRVGGCYGYGWQWLRCLPGPRCVPGRRTPHIGVPTSAGMTTSAGTCGESVWCEGMTWVMNLVALSLRTFVIITHIFMYTLTSFLFLNEFTWCKDIKATQFYTEMKLNLHLLLSHTSLHANTAWPIVFCYWYLKSTTT